MAEQVLERSPLTKDTPTKYGLASVGDLDIEVLDGEGNSIKFADIYGSKPKTIIVFLRHFL